MRQTFKSDSVKESRMTGHFPPSSRVTGVKCFAAAAMTILPTRGLPAEAIEKIIIVEPNTICIAILRYL